MLPVDRQLDHLVQGIDTILPEDGLRRLLEEDRSLRVKFGIDPTAPDVTLGWAVVFRLLRRFQELGHLAVLIVGDFTARVGDPSGRDDTRRRLDAGTVDAFADRCLDMVGDLLLPEPLEIRRNSEWLAPMTMEGVLELTSAVTVAQLLERGDFKERWGAHRPISLVEFVYPLLQGYDSVAVAADIELGGADQLWNLAMARGIQERFGQPPQTAMTVPLLVGTDGTRKMSQSLDNYISIRHSAEEMFGKTMSVPDEAMEEWFVLAAGAGEAEAASIVADVAAGVRHPGETKRLLGRRIVSLYHGATAAEDAEAAFDRLFVGHLAPEEVDAVTIESDAVDVALPELLERAGLVGSRTEVRRLIGQGAVKIDGTPVSAERLPADEVVGKVVQVGKRRFVRVERS
ncbi:MAG: tyrosine--tRNA ligase [Acidimicrobiia bacterium]